MILLWYKWNFFFIIADISTLHAVSDVNKILVSLTLGYTLLQFLVIFWTYTHTCLIIYIDVLRVFILVPFHCTPLKFRLVWDIIGVSLQSFLKKYTYLKSMVYTKLFLKIMFLMLHYRQTQKTWSANHHCWGSDLNLFLFSSRRELFKDLSIVLDNLLLAIKKNTRDYLWNCAQ